MPASVLWLLSEDLTIQQASLLFLNLDPSEYDDVEKQLAHNQPSGYGAIRQALKSALRKGKLKPLQYRSGGFGRHRAFQTARHAGNGRTGPRYGGYRVTP